MAKPNYSDAVDSEVSKIKHDVVLETPSGLKIALNQGDSTDAKFDARIKKAVEKGSAVAEDNRKNAKSMGDAVDRAQAARDAEIEKAGGLQSQDTKAIPSAKEDAGRKPSPEEVARIVREASNAKALEKSGVVTDANTTDDDHHPVLSWSKDGKVTRLVNIAKPGQTPNYVFPDQAAASSEADTVKSLRAEQSKAASDAEAQTIASVRGEQAKGAQTDADIRAAIGTDRTGGMKSMAGDLNTSQMPAASPVQYAGESSAAQETPVPEGPGFFDRAKTALVDAANSPAADAVMRFGNGIAGLTGGQQYPLANAPPQQALASTQAPAAVAPPPGNPTTPDVAGPPPAPPESVTPKLSEGDIGEQGQMQFDPNDPYRDNPIVHGIRQGAAQEAAGVNAQVDAEMKQHHARLDARRELMQKQVQLDIDEKIATQKANEVMDKGMGDYQRLQAQVLDASRTEINPGRYWQNKDAGQKVAAVIAGALFGFTGQGMQYLQHLDAAVEQDINAQKADIANRREGLQNAVRGQETYLQMAHQHGLDGIAAVQAAKAAMYKEMEQKVALAADEYPATQALAMQMQGQLAQKAAEAEGKFTNAMTENSLRAMQAHFKGAGGGAKTPKPQKESAGLVKETEAVTNAGKQLVEMTSDWKDNATGTGSALGALIPGDVGTSLSTSKGYADRTTFYGDEIAPGVLNGKATQAEILRLKADALPKPTISDAESTKRIWALYRSNVGKYRSNYKARLEAGHPVSDMQPPDEYEASLKAEVESALAGKKVAGEKARKE